MTEYSNGAIKLMVGSFKKDIERSQSSINILQKEIEDIQNKCPHNEGWEEVNYEWAPGHVMPSKMCNVCGKIEVIPLSYETEWFEDSIQLEINFSK